MKQLNEVARMQQLAGIIKEIKIDKPFIKMVNGVFVKDGN